MAGLGIADGSRGKYNVGILTPEQQCHGIGHDIPGICIVVILKLTVCEH